jgi:hypothetical protein
MANGTSNWTVSGPGGPGHIVVLTYALVSDGSIYICKNIYIYMAVYTSVRIYIYMAVYTSVRIYIYMAVYTSVI